MPSAGQLKSAGIVTRIWLLGPWQSYPSLVLGRSGGPSLPGPASRTHSVWGCPLTQVLWAEWALADLPELGRHPVSLAKFVFLLRSDSPPQSLVFGAPPWLQWVLAPKRHHKKPRNRPSGRNSKKFQESMSGKRRFLHVPLWRHGFFEVMTATYQVFGLARAGHPN